MKFSLLLALLTFGTVGVALEDQVENDGAAELSIRCSKCKVIMGYFVKDYRHGAINTFFLRVLCIICLVKAKLNSNPLINVYNETAEPKAEDDDLMNGWHRFKQKYHKSYEMDEDRERFAIFARNKRMVDAHNKQYREEKTTYSMKINHLSDWTPDELRNTLGCVRMPTNASGDFSYMPPHHVMIPKSIDWRNHGYVGKVKDQGHCGSCWAFAATGALEGQHARKTHKFVSLSEQNLVDCNNVVNHGCSGGFTASAFYYIKYHHGIDTEKSYPYEGKQGKCRFNYTTVGARCKGVASIEINETMLKIAVATVGPIAVSIDAVHSFYQYHKGVYYEPHCKKHHPNHGVLVIGYGVSDKGYNYWLVKNSWNTGWGNKGYGKMSRDRKNNCGIASFATYPLV